MWRLRKTHQCVWGSMLDRVFFFFSDFPSVLWVSWVCLLFLFFIFFLYKLYSNFFLSLFLDAVEMSLISSFLWSSSHGVSWISLHHGKRFYFCFSLIRALAFLRGASGAYMIINFIFITPHIFPYENTKVKVSTELGRVRRWHIKKRYCVPSVVSSSK